ncbi:MULTISPECIES: DUF3037 domain-containing protein [Dermacoccus]|jgi:hypothetical protein|uniref:DUF3037 domain-containing protein n=1 Tax=Dermacoccus abyssi TaxID=322596 RepID=A0A417ZA23_9MICO|nr:MULTISPECIES: DUF3037 domain-containing protein [Dermacoccus]MBE7372446.1 DUF3037 domain-containing protein [Dermacoccus barathri]MBZ4496493.1 DUF3037 domain-containing protein [Dermacoccus sp. Tok2021]QEH93259.1 DUF3037 domain-containing protein [Dermacoccus abyssi]RHW47497.1 DUF3037 domain-containing protein [Dermacoccus abyssi]RYI23735.1 DUF3037 domain-containing protein [Dermacoccus sp. 147Ba]
MSGIGYQYVLLRLVPSIEREEFLNVGVVVYAQMADFLDARFDLAPQRLEAFAPHLDPADVEAALEGMCAAVRGEACAGRPAMPKLGQRFGWITAPRSTILQPGPLHGGVTDDPALTLDRLVSRLVTPSGG